MSPLYTIFRFKHAETDFYEHFFKSESWHDYLRNASSTGARHDRMAITASAFMRMPVPRPSPAEQRKIAACLTSLDELLAAEERKLEALLAHKKGLMQQLFPCAGESRPRLRFPEFRDGPEWKLAKAGDYVDVLQGYGFPDRLQGRKDGEFPFYKVSDISAVADSGAVLLTDAKNHIDREVLNELRAKPLPVGATVFAKIGEAIRSNKRAVTTRPCLIDNNVAGVKAIAGAAVDKFVYYLWCMVPLIEYAGGVVPAVNKSAIEQILVCFPEPAEQHRIADCLSVLDALIAAASRKLGGLRAHKKGLLQQLFPSPEGV
jgi:type I restriction enzyme S subunit